MARSFNGTSDKIVIANGFTLPADNLTFFAWENSTLGRQGSMMGATGGLTPGGLEFAILTTGKIAIIETGLALLYSSNSTVSANTLTAVGADANTGGSVAHFYINGSSVGATAGSAYSTSPDHVAIGTSSSNEWFPGILEHIAVWNVVLTAAEHLALGKGALPYKIRPTALIGWWPLGLASPEPDFSGFHNSGTLTGTTIASGSPTMMFTPRWPQFTTAAAASSVDFRRTLSPVGTRAGSRQRQGLEST